MRQLHRLIDCFDHKRIDARACTHTHVHTVAHHVFSSSHAVFVFQAVGCLYDFFVWLLPKIMHGTPKRSADAKIFAFHHVVVVFLNLFGLPVCHLTFYACSIGVMEGTGIFLGCLRLMQHLRVEKSNRWYIVNGLCFWLSWTIFRIIWPVNVLTRMYQDWQQASDMFQAVIQTELLVSLVAANIVLFAMNMVWYIKLCKLVLSSLCKSSSRVKKQ